MAKHLDPNVGSKVVEALNKLRNGEQFQVSLSSVLQAKGDKFQTDETQVSFGTDLEASNLTESRFIEGLQRSLDNLLTSDTIVDDNDNEN